MLLCPDQPGWSFDNIATNIIRHAPPGFLVTKYFLKTGKLRDFSDLFQHIVSADIDVVHFFWREDLFEMLRAPTIMAAAAKLDMGLDDMLGIIGTRAFTTSVYDHLFTDESAISERITSFAKIDGYTVSSQKLEVIYASHPDLPSPDATITDGVDLDFFKPGDRHGDSSKVPVVGWVGNSAWGKSRGGDPKGYHRLFAPAMEILRRRGLTIDVALADPQVRRVPFDEMPAYYRGIDILVCTSETEGTPNPVLEAMASGIAIVSTDVGIVPEAFGELQKRFISAMTSPGTLADSIEHLVRNPQTRQQLSAENLAGIGQWTWKSRVTGWWPFWSTVSRRATERRTSLRRGVALAGECFAASQSSTDKTALAGWLSRVKRAFSPS